MRKGLQGLMLGVALGAFGVTGAMAQQPPSPLANWKTITEETMRKPADGDWLMWRRTYANWGYSPLDQINKDNVKGLRVAWTWSLTSGVTEIEPLVHDGVLFVTNAGDKIQALNAATGDLLWEYRRDLAADAVAAAATRSPSATWRSTANYLYIATSDAHVVALDARTGKVAVRSQRADWKKGYRYSSGPFMANGVLVASHERLQCGAGRRLLHHRARSENRRGAVARPYRRAGWRSERQHMERPAARERFGGSAWIAGSLRSRDRHDLPWRRPALSVDRRDARHDAEEGGPRQQRALHGFDARDRAQDRQDEMAPPASRQRHARSRLRL